MWNMHNYNRIRIDRDTVIKVPTRTAGTGEGPIYLFFGETFDPLEEPLTCGGEIADALRAWISGSKVYPVTENGVLNIFGAIVEGITAERALGNFPLMDISSEGLYAAEPNQQKWKPPVALSAVPQVDVEAIARAIKDRK